ncbi:TetR/AcrR family transcriptional regulator [Saccharomonospora sp. NPDC006951]
MAHVRTPRDAWIRAGLDALGEGGPELVRVEELARRLGVTKGGFYGYFDGRAQLLTEMLDAWEREAAAAVIDEADAEGGSDVGERLRALTRGAKARAGGKGAELAIRDWARRDPAIAARTRRVDRTRMAYLHRLFLEVTGDEREAAARAALTAGVWLASHLMRYDTAGHDHDDVLNLAFERTVWLTGEPGGKDGQP